MRIVKTIKGTPKWERRVEYLEKEVIANIGKWEKRGGQKDLLHVVFATRLIYYIRDIIQGRDLDVGWGHVINSETGFIGPECDVLIFRGAPFDEWDGHKDPIIRVVLADINNVCCVIECKKTLRIHKDNPNRLQGQGELKNQIEYVTDSGIPGSLLWLAAGNIEYKNETEREKIPEIVLDYLRYEKFFYFHDAIEDAPNEEDWNLFLDEIEHLI